MLSKELWKKWNELFQTQGVFRSPAHGPNLRTEVVLAFASVVGEQAPEAYVDRGTENDKGQGSITAVAVFGERIIRLDIPYSRDGSGDVLPGEMHVAEAMTAEIRSVGAFVRGRAGGLNPGYFGSEGLVLRLMLPQGLRLEGEGVWWEADLSQASAYKKRWDIYQAWREVLREP